MTIVFAGKVIATAQLLVYIKCGGGDNCGRGNAFGLAVGVINQGGFPFP